MSANRMLCRVDIGMWGYDRIRVGWGGWSGVGWMGSLSEVKGRYGEWCEDREGKEYDYGEDRVGVWGLVA